MSGSFTRDFQIYTANQAFNQQWTFLLSTLTGPTEANHTVDVTITEPTNYTRQQLTFPTLTLAANYDTTNLRVTLPTQTLTFTAPSTGSVQFSSICGLIGGDANSNQAISSVSASNNTITVPTALTSGQLIGVTADSGGSLPSGLSTDTLYEVISGGTTFEISTPGSTTPISLGSTGSGTLRVRYSNGTLCYVDSSMGTVTIPANNTYTWMVNFYNLNSGSQVGS